jgi:hypothetical protein
MAVNRFVNGEVMGEHFFVQTILRGILGLNRAKADMTREEEEEGEAGKTFRTTNILGREIAGKIARFRTQRINLDPAINEKYAVHRYTVVQYNS